MNKIFHITIPVIMAGIFLSAQNPLAIPPALTGTNFNLTIQNGTTQFWPSVNTPTYGINGPLLGPTLIVNKWDTVTMNVTNTLTGNGNSTTMHWHGLHVPAADDGGPHQIIAQNSTWSPTFTILNSAGTFWYHPHGAGKTDLHVSKGLAGMIIVKDSVENALVLPRTYGVDDFPIIVQTKAFDIFNQIAISTGYDTVPMVNGTIDPYLDAPAQVVRLRLLNGSSGRSFMFGFSNNMNFHLIATDGGLLDSSLTMNRLLLSNGERAEILVDLSALLNSAIYLMNYGSEIPNGIMGADSVGNAVNMPPDYYNNSLNGSDFQLLQINVGAPTGSPITTIATQLTTLSPWSPVSAVKNREFILDTLSDVFVIPDLAEGPFGINRHRFAMDSINEIVNLNAIEIWTIHNKTLVAHPFHIHDIQFYILNINGGPVPPELRGQKDVVLVMPGDSVQVITKFSDFANDTVPYMYHCHLLHHEDDGMMGSFIVIDSTNLNGIVRHENYSDISFYPVPADDELIIHHSKYLDEAKVEIFNSIGESVYSAAGSGTSLQIPTADLSAGIYFIRIMDHDVIHVAKFIVTHQ